MLKINAMSPRHVVTAVALTLVMGCDQSRPNASVDSASQVSRANDQPSGVGAPSSRVESAPSKQASADEQKKTAAESKITHLDGAGAVKLLAEKEGVQVLDVRTSGEFASGYIKGAKLQDISQPSFREEVAALDRSRPYLIYCASGMRSRRALSIMKSLGFVELYHLDGGVGSWVRAGQQLER